MTRFAGQVVAATIAADGTIYMVSHEDAPRGKILALPASDPTLAHAKLLVAQSEFVIQAGGEFGAEPVVVTPTALYVRELVGGPSHAGGSITHKYENERGMNHCPRRSAPCSGHLGVHQIDN